MSDLTVTDDEVSVVEIHANPYSVTEVIGLDTAGLVEVHDSTSAFIVTEQPLPDVIEVVTAGPIGPRGPIGPEGPQGPFAPIFEQHFADPSMVWVINHDLGVIPVVTLYDENHEEIVGDVMTPDRNTVIVTFEVPFAGTARLKA